MSRHRRVPHWRRGQLQKDGRALFCPIGIQREIGFRLFVNSGTMRTTTVFQGKSISTVLQAHLRDAYRPWPVSVLSNQFQKRLKEEPRPRRLARRKNSPVEITECEANP